VGGAPVRVEATGYTIEIAAGALARVGEMANRVAKAHRYAIITDSIVGPLYASQVAAQFTPEAVSTFAVPTGEEHKNRDSWASLTDQLSANGFTRDTTIIALGGGVVGDLAGFVAATFMRGVPFLQVPTTLLAMIDASIGGKTGVDTPAGKNLVGAFHPPRAVIADPDVLATLPLPHLRGGLAEAVKHGAIADETYFQTVGDAASRLLHPTPDHRDVHFLHTLIERSVRIKTDVVARDTHEHGVRKILNFGHTIGHAIELLSGFTMSHGDAVAAGMVLESAAAERAKITTAGTTARITDTLRTLGLPVTRPTGPSPDDILDIMRGDKKSRAGSIEYAVPERIGTMAGATNGFAVRIDDTIVRDVLADAVTDMRTSSASLA
jgi:3-dehydroquinate synthase